MTTTPSLVTCTRNSTLAYSTLGKEHLRGTITRATNQDTDKIHENNGRRVVLS